MDKRSKEASNGTQVEMNMPTTLRDFALELTAASSAETRNGRRLNELVLFYRTKFRGTLDSAQQVLMDPRINVAARTAQELETPVTNLKWDARETVFGD
jgi:hypothetical protein